VVRHLQPGSCGLQQWERNLDAGTTHSSANFVSEVQTRSTSPILIQSGHRLKQTSEVADRSRRRSSTAESRRREERKVESNHEQILLIGERCGSVPVLIRALSSWPISEGSQLMDWGPSRSADLLVRRGRRPEVALGQSVDRLR
jgi:hypothetical protein